MVHAHGVEQAVLDSVYVTKHAAETRQKRLDSQVVGYVALVTKKVLGIGGLAYKVGKETAYLSVGSVKSK